MHTYVETDLASHVRFPRSVRPTQVHPAGPDASALLSANAYVKPVPYDGNASVAHGEGSSVRPPGWTRFVPKVRRDWDEDENKVGRGWMIPDRG